MRITSYNLDGSVAKVKDVNINIPSQVEAYNDDSIFYDIPERLVWDKFVKQHDDYAFMLNRIQFLVKHDYTQYCVSPLSDKIPFAQLSSDEEVESFAKNLINEEVHTYSDNPLFESFFSELLDVLANSGLGIICRTQAEYTIAEKKGILFLKGLQFIKEYYEHKYSAVKDADHLSFDFINEPLLSDLGIDEKEYFDHLYLISYLQPFLSVTKAKCDFTNEDFLIALARTLFNTKGKNRSILYKIIQILNGVRLGNTSAYHVNNTLMCYQQGTTSFMVGNDGTRTVNIGKDATISYTIAECAAVTSGNESLSTEDYNKIIDDIKAEYESHKKNNAFLKEEFDSDCESQTEKHGKLYKENWIEFKNKTKQGWESCINTSTTRKKLNPIVCFYRLILKYESNNGYFSRAFVQDFMSLCTRNNPFEIAPELFDEMFLMEYINQQIKNSEELPYNTSNLSINSNILSFSPNSFSGDLFSNSLEDILQEEKRVYFHYRIETILDLLLKEYDQYASNTKVTNVLIEELNKEAYMLNKGSVGEPSSWGIVYTTIVERITKECKQNTQDSAPWNYYRSILGQETHDIIIKLSKNELVSCLYNNIVENNGASRALIYKVVFILNYIKEKQGFHTSSYKEYKFNIDTTDPLIQQVIAFLEPITNYSFINPDRLNVDGFIGLMISILSNELFIDELKDCRKLKELNIKFNVNLLLNILGMLNSECNDDKGYIITKGGRAISQAFFNIEKANDDKYSRLITNHYNKKSDIMEKQADYIKTEAKRYSEIYRYSVKQK